MHCVDRTNSALSMPLWSPGRHGRSRCRPVWDERIQDKDIRAFELSDCRVGTAGSCLNIQLVKPEVMSDRSIGLQTAMATCFLSAVYRRSVSASALSCWSCVSGRQKGGVNLLQAERSKAGEDLQYWKPGQQS